MKLLLRLQTSKCYCRHTLWTLFQFCYYDSSNFRHNVCVL